MDIVKAIADASRRCWRLFTPDMSRDERRELAQSQTWKEQERDRIVALAQRQRAEMLAEERRVARQLAATEHKAVDGLGEFVGSIPEKTYFQMMAEHGDDCWGDPGFIEAFFRDNPGLRAKTKYGTRGQEYVSDGRGSCGLVTGANATRGKLPYKSPFTRNGAIRA